MNTAKVPPTDGHNHSPVDHEMDHEMERAARARLKMGWGQRSVVALLLTVVLVPPLAGFYSYFSGIPLHLLASTKDDKDTVERFRPTQHLSGRGVSSHGGAHRRGRRLLGSPQG